jgi:hypothetical protein
MPTLNIPQTIDISPERYINACSKTEIFELNILLASPRFSAPQMGDEDPGQWLTAEQFRKVLNAGGYGTVAERHKLGAIFSDNQDEALKIMDDISAIVTLSAAEILQLMKPFQALEKLRIKSLVKLPQALNNES